MAIIAFQKPDKVLMLEADNFYGKFELKPLEPGYGATVGNALRRVLLNSLEGYAISSIKIDGVKHEFDTIPGVKEDVSGIILNLKQVNLKQIVEDTDFEKATITVSGTQEFTAGDIGKALSGFEVMNQNPNDEMDVIAIDSIYTPIVNVKFAVENFRVDQKTDYDKLILEITTNGTILPKDALKEAAKILIYHFMVFSDEKITLETTETDSNEEFDEEVLKMRQLLKSKLVDMNLSVRALNCLKSAEVETLAELVVFNKTDLLKFRNFGKKSLTELEELLTSLNLSFGMDISKYKLDKD